MWRLAPSGQAFFVPYAGVEYVERQEVDAPPLGADCNLWDFGQWCGDAFGGRVVTRRQLRLHRGAERTRQPARVRMAVRRCAEE